jgi:hypothetical protein
MVKGIVFSTVRGTEMRGKASVRKHSQQIGSRQSTVRGFGGEKRGDLVDGGRQKRGFVAFVDPIDAQEGKNEGEYEEHKYLVHLTHLLNEQNNQNETEDNKDCVEPELAGHLPEFLHRAECGYEHGTGH